MHKEDRVFYSHGSRCHGYLYQPDTPSARLPCIVMAHGFGATRECGLAPFAEAFCQAGYAVFVFDYRHFGDSDGEPRQLLSPRRETEDWLAAVHFVRTLKEIDNQRIALWGSSFSGGLVTVTAALDGHIQCLIAQCPMMDGLASVLEVIRYAGPGQALKLTGHGLLDLARATVGLTPHYIASAGKPGEVAAMTADDCWDGYLSLIPEGVPNRVAARIGLTLPLFRPLRHADGVTCPALIQLCEKDTVAPVKAAEKAAAAMRDATVVRYPVGHFDVYHGEARAKSIEDQLQFLNQHLPVN